MLRKTCRVVSSFWDRNNGPSVSHLELFCSTAQVIDLIPFSMNKPWENASLLHEKYVVLGLSLKQIAREFFCSKNTIRSALRRSGIRLRKRQEKGRASNPRYGLKPMKGYPVTNFGEQRIITAIMEMQKDGLSFTKIAKFLTAAGVPTKMRRRKWHPEVVRQICLNNAPGNRQVFKYLS